MIGSIGYINEGSAKITHAFGKYIIAELNEAHGELPGSKRFDVYCGIASNRVEVWVKDNGGEIPYKHDITQPLITIEL